MQPSRFILLLFLIGFFPCFVEAAQIAPNPNPAGSTIDIINDGSAVNNELFVNGGTININSASTLTNSVGARLLNSSPSLVNGATVNNAGIVNNYGSVGNSLAVLTNAIGATFNNYGILDNSMGGSLTNAGTLNNYAGGAVAFGAMIPTKGSNTGTINNFASALLDLGEWSPRNAVGATINNHGLMRTTNGALLNDGLINNFGSYSGNGAHFENAVGAVLNNQGTMVVTGQTIQNAGTFRNGGSLSLYASAIVNTGTFINTGAIDHVGIGQTAGLMINNGNIISTRGPDFLTSVQGGSLMGAGTVAGLVTIGTAAILAPGDTTTLGKFTIHGNLESSGNVLFRIQGFNVGQFDVLDVGGDANFSGGTMSFGFTGFDPQIGNSWDFLYASAITGWDSLTFLFSGLDSTERAQFHFHDGIQTLRIVAVPEPGSFILLASAFAGVAVWRRLKASR